MTKEEQKTPLTEGQKIQNELSEIRQILARYEKRERRTAMWRTISGIIKLLPIAISLYFAYYFYTSGEEIIKNIIQESVSLTGNIFGSSNGGEEILIETTDPSVIEKLRTLLGEQ